MNWSGSLSGYFDDADDTIFNYVVAGNIIYLRFYDDRNVATDYWQGQALLTSVEHGVTTEDFATLNVDFEGIGERVSAVFNDDQVIVETRFLDLMQKILYLYRFPFD